MPGPGESQPAGPGKPLRRGCSRRMRLVAATAVVLGLIGGWFWKAVREAREAAIACGAMCPFSQLVVAFHGYHDAHGCFPPAYLADAQGVPMHSWRVLILPFVEQKPLYDAYRFDEPWNGPNNRKLADQMPRIFHVCSEPDSTTMTNVVVIVGPGTAFPGPHSTRIKDFVDGLDQTILLAEIADSNIPWLEPRDLHVGEMSFRVNDKRKPSISSSRRGGPYVVFADSVHVYPVSAALPPEALWALTTIAGNEKVRVTAVPGVGLSQVGGDADGLRNGRGR